MYRDSDVPVWQRSMTIPDVKNLISEVNCGSKGWSVSTETASTDAGFPPPFTVLLSYPLEVEEEDSTSIGSPRPRARSLIYA